MNNIAQLVKKIPPGKYPGSSLVAGVMYHDLPYGELATFTSHRGQTIQRVKQIVDNINLTGKSVLDIGCSVGGIALGCALNGAAQVAGVDYDPESIAVARQAAMLLGLEDQVQFEVATVDQVWADELGQIDVVIWLSHWMWLVKQLGLEPAKDLLFTVASSCQELVFESAAADGMAAIADTTQEDIKLFLEESTAFTEIMTLPPVPGWMGRNLYVCRQPQLEINCSTSKIRRISRGVVRKEVTFLPHYLERELYFLNKLQKYDIVPKIISHGHNYLDLSYAGRSLSTFYPVGQRQEMPSFKTQLEQIATILEQEGIQHRDIHGNNLVVLGGKIRLVDWSWAIDQNHADFRPHRVPEEALGQGLWEISGKSDRRCLELITEGIFNGDDYQVKYSKSHG